MAGPYYVWSGATGGATGADWTNAFTTIKAAVDACSGAADTIYVHTGASSTHSETLTTSETWTGVADMASGVIRIIGTDKDTGSPGTYTISASANVTQTSGDYVLMDGSFEMHGIYIAVSGTASFDLRPDANEVCYLKDCTIDGSSGTPAHVLSSAIASGKVYVVDCTIGNGTDDSMLLNPGEGDVSFIGCTFTGGSGAFYLMTIGLGSRSPTFIGCDFSGSSFDYICSAPSEMTPITFYGCRLSSTTDINTWSNYASIYAWESDTDSGNNQYRAEIKEPIGTTCSIDTSTYLAATYDGSTGYSYVISQGDTDVGPIPAYSPWSTGYLSSTGSTTFTVNISNETANYDDTQVWLELEYFGASGNTLKTIADDRNASPVTALGSGTQQTTNSEAWTGLTSDFPQELSVTVTIGRAGSYRWRVGSRVATDIYIDPKIEIS